MKQTSAKSTGCRASPRKPSELVGRELVLSGFVLKARPSSGPGLKDIHGHQPSRIAKAPAQGLPAVNSGKDMSESTPNMLPSIDQGGGVDNDESKAHQQGNNKM